MRDDTNSTAVTSALVSKIDIEKLFGRYDYRLEIPSTESGAVSRIAMIYGDNGTGKTTILGLLFHLLSPADDRGHRTAIGRIPFARFSVAFSNGTEISVEREAGSIIGQYTITFAKAGSHPLSGLVGLDPEGRAKPETLTPGADKAIREICNLGLPIFFLSDDRRLQTDAFRGDQEEYFVAPLPSEIGTPFPRVPPNPRDTALRLSLDVTSTWVSRRLIEACSRGEADAQHIYATIVETINKLGVPEIKDQRAEKEQLIEELKQLDKRSDSFTEFGLVAKVDTKRFVQGLADTKPKGFPFVAQVVRSFIHGQKARLDALEDLNTLLARFVKLINGFLVDKYIELDVERGISILLDSRTSLSSENLSSGEKQLLLLFCNVLTSSDSASLFIIDEPEISLNVKWQRRLVDVLMDITKGSQCQFLLATHSIELLAKHRRQTIKLVPR